MTIPQLDRPKPSPSLREHALLVIRHAITTGDLDESRIYSAAGLAKQLGMSLSPVREAMMSLVAEGTVEAVPNRGFRLVPVTRDDLEEIIRIRSLLAVPAAQELCRRAAEADNSNESIGDQLATLRRFATEAVTAAEAEDRAEYFAADREFHERLLEYGLGPRAAAISLRLRDQSRVFTLDAEARKIDILSARELVQIVDLIEADKPAEVGDLVVQNLYYFKRTEANEG